MPYDPGMRETQKNNTKHCKVVEMRKRTDFEEKRRRNRTKICFGRDSDGGGGSPTGCERRPFSEYISAADTLATCCIGFPNIYRTDFLYQCTALPFSLPTSPI